MSFHKYAAAILSLLISATAIADDDRVEGHMVSLSNELLAQPITLSCGVTIKEWRGTSTPSKPVVEKLDALCDKAKKNFKPFLAARNLKAPGNDEFSWNWVLIPDGQCYRCMNDVKYRFKYRFVRQNLWGYTGRDERHTFTVSNIYVKDPTYSKIFVHELFHALSMHFGLYDSHSSDDYEKTRTDERLAQQFTQYMGFGR